MRPFERAALGIVGALLLAGWALPAQAASLPALHEVFLVFDSVTEQITQKIGDALGTHEIEMVVNVLFSALALGLFVWKFSGYALRGFDLLDMMALMMTLFFVYLILSAYKAIFPAIFGAGRYVSDVLGAGISGRDPKVSLAENIFGMVVQVDFHSSCDLFDCLGPGIMSWIAAIFAYIIVIALGIIATLVELWTMWGFQIAYAIGWLTVPFLLFERLSFLFDGWLKFFFGMVVYVMVAKVNLALVLLGLEIMFGIAHGGGIPDTQTVDVDGFFSIVGMLVFLAVGIATLYSTGRFASAIVQNAAGGGVGEVVQRAASAAATAAGAAMAVAL
jgi:hypothetical protein